MGEQSDLTLGDKVTLFAIECGFDIQPWQMTWLAAIYADREIKRP